MDAEKFSKGLENKNLMKPMMAFGVIWVVLLLILWVIGWVLYKVGTDEEILGPPEKDIRSTKVIRGTAEGPDDWDNDL